MFAVAASNANSDSKLRSAVGAEVEGDAAERIQFCLDFAAETHKLVRRNPMGNEKSKRESCRTYYLEEEKGGGGGDGDGDGDEF